jgi:hypothetical protein
MIPMKNPHDLHLEIDPQPLATIRWVVLASSTAANNNSPPTPGYREAGSRLFYVTERGRCWLVRDEHGRVELTPAVLPRGACVVDVLIDMELGIVEEAADLLDQRQAAGIYHASEIFYYLSERGDAWMLYGPDLTLVLLARLPPDAAVVDLPPHEITAVVVRLKEAG